MKQEKTDKPSCSSELHCGHLCELESSQNWDTLRQVTDNPSVRCENCGGAANSSRNVCIPGDL
jgi:hypothetical protein